MTPADYDSSQQDATGTPARRLERLRRPIHRAVDWAKIHRLKAALLACAGVATVAGLLGMGYVLVSLDWNPQPTGLAAALQALDEGRYEEARLAAESLRSKPKPTLEILSGTAFVLGAAAAAEADLSYTGDRRQQHLVAAAYLDEAYDRGFPPGREAEGLFLLGKCLYVSGQYPQCRVVLREALKHDPDRASEIHRLLSGAYASDAAPDYAKALEHNAQYLADRALLPQERNRGLLDRARILLRLGQLAECRDTLGQIPDEATNQAEVLVIRAQVVMREAATLGEADAERPDKQVDALEKYQEAVKLLQQAASRDTLSAHVSGRAMYLIGVCLAEAGQNRAAFDELTRTTRTYPGTSEAVAADFRLAKLLHKLGRDAEAVSAYRRVLRSFVDPHSLNNRWITLDQLQKGVMDAYRAYVEAEKYHFAVELAKAFYPAYSRTRTLELVAQAYRQWGTARLAASADLPRSQAEPLVREAREQLRRAGLAYQRLAGTRITSREYSEDLWQSADSYLGGHNFTHAARMFEEYLKNETRQRRPRALLGLGEARLALGQPDEALEALDECIEFHPRDAATFRVRMVAADAHAEKGEMDQARELLEANLDRDELTPASGEWRQSLFALGRLLHTEGLYEDAAIRLEEAVKRYPAAPEAIDGRYLLGHCYLASAQEDQKKLAADVVPATRTARKEKIQKHLGLALDRYREAQQAIFERQQAAELSPLESTMLRNCSFAIAGVLFDLGQYEAAVQGYMAVVSRYQKSPAVLEAYVEMARTYRRLGRTDEARGAVKQAKIALAEIPAEDQFAATTIHGRKEWADLLDKLETM